MILPQTILIVKQNIERFMDIRSYPSAFLIHIKTLQHQKYFLGALPPYPEALEIIKIPRRRALF